MPPRRNEIALLTTFDKPWDIKRVTNDDDTEDAVTVYADPPLDELHDTEDEDYMTMIEQDMRERGEPT